MIAKQLVITKTCYNCYELQKNCFYNLYFTVLFSLLFNTIRMHILSKFVVGLQFGDEGKGKIIDALAAEDYRQRMGTAKNLVKDYIKYDYCVRYNGGPNAGHTIYHAGKKFVTHQIPSGIIYGIPSIVCDNCFVDINKLIGEIKYLNGLGVETAGLITLSTKCNIITAEHIAEDSKDTAIGTTKSGIGQCAAAKYARTGIRICDIDQSELKAHGVTIADPLNIFMDFYMANGRHPRFLVEGAQAFKLDITHGTYPYVTSSHCLVSDCFNTGINFSPTDTNGNTYEMQVWGVCKAYETYVGAMKFQPEDDPVLEKIQEIGREFGATTGRKRQCNYFDITSIIRAGFANQISRLVINKLDILDHPDIKKFVIIEERGEKREYEKEEFKSVIKATLHKHRLPNLEKIYFEETAEGTTVFE